MSNPAEPHPGRTRIRLRFSKLGKVRFTSHRDTARIWERALRRVDAPVAYTEGFSPRPRLSFGLALPTGHESLGEYLDVDLDLTADRLDLDQLIARLDPALPVGFTAQGAAVVEPGTPSLQEAVTSCTWHMEVIGADPGVVAAAVEQLLQRDQLVVTRERKGRDVTEDLRPALLELALRGPTPSGTELVAELATQPRALRPGDLLGVLAEDVAGAGPAGVALASAARVCRAHQWMVVGGVRREPLAAPPRPPVAPPLQELRAS
jgi:radical SAM-linked protein